MATVLMLHRVVKMDNKFHVQQQLASNWIFVTKLEVLAYCPEDKYNELAEWPTALEARQWCVNKIGGYKHYKPIHLEIVGEVFGLAE